MKKEDNHELKKERNGRDFEAEKSFNCYCEMSATRVEEMISAIYFSRLAILRNFSSCFSFFRFLECSFESRFYFYAALSFEVKTRWGDWDVS